MGGADFGSLLVCANIFAFFKLNLRVSDKLLRLVLFWQSLLYLNYANKLRLNIVATICLFYYQ